MKNGKLNRKLARSHSSSLETTDQVKQLELKLSGNQINKLMLIFDDASVHSNSCLLMFWPVIK
jgi:hypothetical protein